MKDKRILTIGIIVGVLAVVGGRGISAQDKYTAKVPGGLAFAEFRGYEPKSGSLEPSSREETDPS